MAPSIVRSYRVRQDVSTTAINQLQFYFSLTPFYKKKRRRQKEKKRCAGSVRIDDLLFSLPTGWGGSG